jgi:ribosomal protein S18 acetylase RimI-like enzyme
MVGVIERRRIVAITDRPYRDEGDFWALRRLVTDLYGVQPPGRPWDVRRWDGRYFYSAEPGFDERTLARLRIWEDEDGRVVAALLSEGGRAIHPHVHPDVAEIEEEVLATGEELAAAAGDREVEVLCYHYDAARRRVLESRGYQQSPDWAVIRLLRFGRGPLPEPQVAAGYRIRTTRDDDADHQGLADLLNAAFRRTIHHAGETRGFQANAPCFRRELDLVAEAPDGTPAAYAAVCWDEANRTGIFEPVCTHPDHRRRGLAGALMREGMRRARAAGAVWINVETGSMDPANALYDSLGFAEEHRGFAWRKAL